MRIAVLADIHGNLLALEAVLAALPRHAPDLVVNLGDHLSGPLQAAATADLLIGQRDWVQIRGNHDRQLIEHAADAMGLSDRAAFDQLGDGHKNWLRALPATVALDDGILLCHGTPACDLTYLLEESTPTGVWLATPDRIRESLGATTGVVLCGHSHIPRFVRLPDGTLVLNPGSVGLPAYDDPDHRFPHVMEVGSPHARYAILDRAGAAWRATFHTVEYDWDSASQLACDSGRPDWAHALATGYATARQNAR